MDLICGCLLKIGDIVKYKISIILPVYNVEDYIREALESIMRQTIGFQNLEVIMVDDYSTDKSGEIIDEYARKYYNFIAIHLPENSGSAGKPRNAGIKNANSDYLMFLDPDDYYTDEACEILYNKMIKENADIITGKFEILLESGKITKPSKRYELYSTSAREIKNIKIKNKKLLYHSHPSLWAKIIKRDFIKKNDITFPERIPGQDFAFITHCYLKTDRIIYINENILVQRKRETKNKSISHIRTNKYINGVIEAYFYTYQICKENNAEEFPLIMEYRLPFWFSQLVQSELTISEKESALKSIMPLLKIYNKSGLTLPLRFMPPLKCIIDEKYDEAIVLLDQLKGIKVKNVDGIKLPEEDNTKTKDNTKNSIIKFLKEPIKNQIRKTGMVRELEMDKQKLMKQNECMKSMIELLKHENETLSTELNKSTLTIKRP